MLTRKARLRGGQAGFTLIELLVVVAIIALLATFAVPKLFDAINKAKQAPGDADLKTLSSGMERHYFDNSFYPKPTTPSDVMNAMKDGYVKASTTFLNGFGKGYMYLSNTNGTFYILIDPQNRPATSNIYVWCGTDAAHAEATVNSSASFQAIGTAATWTGSIMPTKDQIKTGCKAGTKNAAGTAMTDLLPIAYN